MSKPKPLVPAAIVGYGFRLPGGLNSETDFWRLLRQREVVQEPIEERYGRGHLPIGPFSGPGRLASPFEGLIQDGDEASFDHAFFGMAYNEVKESDMQTRMILNCAWEAIEHVGWDLKKLHNSPTGVFIGSQAPAVANWRPQHGVSQYSPANVSLAMLANRISYYFNLAGSSASYCTACSAGLSALHAAMHALAVNECEQALVGAVNYMGSGRFSSGFNMMGVISSDGLCRSFDAEANGYMRSEGAFVFAIKTVEAAERDGDPIYAVVESTAVNAAGSADGAIGVAPGRFISAPTKHSQVVVMRQAAARAGYTPDRFDYIEAHATGTKVGDPIEGNAIVEAYSATRTKPLRVCSVKSNLGHMESAAFHCALLKVVLMMKHRTFAPMSKSFRIPNPEIDFDACPMHVQTVAEPFPDHPVVVGINSFGFGGANGHCVVREYRPEHQPVWSVPLAPKAGFMIPLSARSSKTLVESTSRLRQFLDVHTPSLYTLAANLSRRRTAFSARAAFVAQDIPELKSALDDFVQSDPSIIPTEYGYKAVAMVFSGQGTQWAGCGRILYDTHPVFRRVIDAIEEYWMEVADFSLREACFSAAQEALDECELAQPVIFALQCALVELFKTWGVYADCVVGHSSGEVAAAYACGALNLEDATLVAYHRSRLQQRVAGSGRMLSLGLDIAGVEDLLDDLGISIADGRLPSDTTVEIACENSPASTVICGRMTALQPVVDEALKRNLQCSLIPGNIAFHSRAMDAVREDILEALEFLTGRTFHSDIPFISSITGLTERNLDGVYWWSNIRQPVRFAAAMATVVRDHEPNVVLEIAPHSALQPLIQQCLDSSNSRALTIGSLKRDGSDTAHFQEALGMLFKAGVDLDFAAQYPKPAPLAHLLPGHPRENERINNVAADDEAFQKRSEYAHGPLVGHRIPCDHPLFEARLSEAAFPWLLDHRLLQSPVMPAAGFIELILQVFEGRPVYVERVEFQQRCLIPKIPVRLQTSLIPSPHVQDAFSFTVSTQPYLPDVESEVLARGKVRIAEPTDLSTAPIALSEIDTSSYLPLPGILDENYYDGLEALLDGKFQYGPAFRTAQHVVRDPKTGYRLIEAEMDETTWLAAQREGYLVFPTLLDSALQGFLLDGAASADTLAVPLRAENISFYKKPTSPRLTIHLTHPGPLWFTVDDMGQYAGTLEEEWLSGSITCYDRDTGDIVLHIEKYTCHSSNPARINLKHSKHRIAWQPKFISSGTTIEQQLPDGDITAASLLAALEHLDKDSPRLVRALEFAESKQPAQTALSQCTEHLTNPDTNCEYWLASSDSDSTRANYEALHMTNAPLRFVSLDQPEDDADIFHEGLLRRSSVEVIIAHGKAERYDWEMWCDLLIEGGLVLLFHDENASVNPGTQWETLRSSGKTTLLQAKPTVPSESSALPGPRWAIGTSNSWAQEWNSLINQSGDVTAYKTLFAETDFPEDEAVDIQAVDIFFEADSKDATGAKAVADLVSFVQTLNSCRVGQATSRCLVTIVTNRAVMDVDNPSLTALWGAIRCMALEVDKEALIDFRLVDLGERSDLEQLAALAHHDLREREFAVRDGLLWVPRLHSIPHAHAHVPADEDPPYRIIVKEAGQISGLQVRTSDPVQPSADSVEIDVQIAALNFRDVMVTLGLLPALAYEHSAIGHELGMEAAGVVRRTGTNVKELKPGDEVIVVGAGCLANRTVADQQRVFPKPPILSMEEAGSALSVYATAYYALIHLARLRKGQRVLIHSAMGGVGQAAIALAHYVGAEIYATAGNDSKRQSLLGLGVTAAFDSHNTKWCDNLLRHTEGLGVDVVLNSLAGPHVELCLKALRPGGWHCEIGKVDIYADSALGMRVFRKNLHFVAIDMDRLMLDDSELSRQVSEACLDLLNRRQVPPLPVTVFSFGDYEKAIRLMMAGKHVGKLALRVPTAPLRDHSVTDRRPFLDPDATYFVTGGYGGLGLRMLPYLVLSGARHFTMMDRDPSRGRTGEWLRQETALRAIGIDVEFDIVKGNVANEADVQRCLGSVKRPLKGVFHLAGVLDDVLLADLTRESVFRVFEPKALGALHLHRATSQMDLDHFVMVSSTTATFGNAGQVNYGGANAFLDGLANLRRRQGLPALSYRLSAVAEAGMAARSLGVLRLMYATGMPPVSAYFTAANLDFAMRDADRADHIITALFKKVLWTVDSPDYLRIGHILDNQSTFDFGASQQMTVEDITVQIAAKVAELCGHSELEIEDPLSSFGLTSIAIAELGAFLQTEYGFQASALELMTTATCQSLARAILQAADSDQELEVSDDLAEHADSSSRIRTDRSRKPSAFAIPLEDHFPLESHPAPDLGMQVA